MAMLPSSILKQLTARAIKRTEKIKSAVDVDKIDTPLIKANKKTGNYYLMYDEVIRCFLLAGYSEMKAEKYIKLWKENNLADVWYLDSYRIIGFAPNEIERAML